MRSSLVEVSAPLSDRLSMPRPAHMKAKNPLGGPWWEKEHGGYSVGSIVSRNRTSLLVSRNFSYRPAPWASGHHHQAPQAAARQGGNGGAPPHGVRMAVSSRSVAASSS
jgi:hypothetical protein